MSVFPIGVGPSYDRTELSVLGHQGNQDNTLNLNSMDQLRMLMSLGRSYIERMCRGAYTYFSNSTFPGENYASYKINLCVGFQLVLECVLMMTGMKER